MKKLTFLIATALACFSVAPAGATTTITDVAVNVVFPYAGDAAIPEFTKVTLPADANYEVVDLQFYDNVEGNLFTGQLSPNTTYQCVVSVQPKEGYVFPTQSGTTKPDATAMTLSINGEKPKQTMCWLDYKIRLLTRFTTGDLSDTIKNVAVNVVFPEAGDTIAAKSATVTLPEGANYKVISLKFAGADGNWVSETKFNPNTTYKLVVHLQPKDGYVFPTESTENTIPDVNAVTLLINGEKPKTLIHGKNYLLGFSTLFTTGNADFLGTPTFSNNSSWFVDSTNITMACGTEGATIYYTTDGTEPSATNGTKYTDEFTLYATGDDVTLKAIAVKDDKASEVASNTYKTYLSVLISAKDDSEGRKVILATKVPVASPVEIRYTTDGTTTSESSTLYTAPFTITETTTIKARVYGVKNIQTLDDESKIERKPDTITNVSVNVIFPEAGDTIAAESATVTLPEGANYKVILLKFAGADGNGVSETKFNPNTTYKLVVHLQPKDGYVFPTESTENTIPDVNAVTLLINGEKPKTLIHGKNYLLGFSTPFTTGNADFLGTPTFSNNSSGFVDSTNITMACGTEGATIYYTTDGTEPSATNGTKYTDEFTLYATGDDVTLKAIAVKGDKASEVASNTYKTYLSVLISAENGSEGSKVTLATKVPVASPVEIRYTTDGTTTSESSTLYTAPFTITETTTIKARVYGVKNIQTLDNESVIDTSTAINTVTCDELRTDNGRIYGTDDIRIYDLLGRDVTRLNGSLCGVYVVKSGNAAVKVVVK